MKKLLVLSLAICTLLLSACQGMKITKTYNGVKNAEVEDSESLENLKLRDKKELYNMYDPTEVVTMYLTVSRGSEGENTDHSWEEINTYSVYDYEDMGVDRYKVLGLLQVGDESGPLPGKLGYGQVSSNCTVQVRGQTSSSRGQKNYKISIKDNKGQWRGQQTIALNKHVSDPTRIRNKMAYDLMAGIDEMMGLRTTFVHLYVKDTTAGATKFRDYGLYTQVEQLNKTALAAHGLNRDGHLYKINFFEFYRYEDIIKLKDDPAYDEKAFEEILETKGDDDHTKLINMLELLNDYSYPMEKILDEHFDTENLAYWMAFHILMGNADTQSRNAYIYSPLNSEKWYFYSWDNDGMLGKESRKLEKRQDAIEWERGVSNYWGNVLFQRALKTEKFRNELDKAINDLRGYLTVERLSKMINDYNAVVEPYINRMPDINHLPLTHSQRKQALNAMPYEIEENYLTYKQSYENPMPFFIGTPVVKNGKIIYTWESSFDFQGDDITYNFILDKNYNFTNPIMKAENTKITMTEGEKLPPGQYFIRVEAFDSKGNRSYAFDNYIIETGKVYGTLSFFVKADGSIEVDIYDEG